MIVHLVASSGFGFIGDANRLNVAITRAKDFMFVVGNFTAMDDFLIYNVVAKNASVGERADAMKLRSIRGLTKDVKEKDQLWRYKWTR